MEIGKSAALCNTLRMTGVSCGFAGGRVKNPPAKIAASVGQGYGLAAPEVNKGSAGYFVCAE